MSNTKDFNKAQATLNTIRAMGSETYQNAVPEITSSKQRLNEIGDIIIGESEQYNPIRNEFINNLFNVIIKVIIDEKSFTNILSELKKGYVAPLGTDIELLHVNPVNPRKYNGDDLAGVLKTYKPDVKSLFIRRNREEVFPVTIRESQLLGAFNSWTDFNKFVQECINACYSGDQIREMNLFKEAVVTAVNNNTVLTSNIEYPTDVTAKRQLANIRTISTNMTIPSSRYNKYKQLAVAQGAPNTITPVVTWTNRDRLIIIIRSDLFEFYGVEVLASAFNMELADFRDRYVLVDDFGYDVYDTDTGTITGHVTSDIGYVIADISAFQFYDNLREARTDYNGYALAFQYFYHVWQTLEVVPFANFIAFKVSEASDDLIGLSASDTAVEIPTGTASYDVTINTIPEGYTGEFSVTYIGGSKDSETMSKNNSPITASVAGNKVTFTLSSSGTVGTYETSWSVQPTGQNYPNVIISVGTIIS